ncbi:MAG: GTPase Era [Bacteroidales bacterium]
MTHRAGFVNIVGNPNVGKSTLMNALVGEKLSIITSKMQTTRHRIKGIVNGDDFQIIYSDTPGILKPAYKLQEQMMNYVNSALGDADVILYVTDIYETPDKNVDYIEKCKGANVPIILVINKIDNSNDTEINEKFAFWEKTFPEAYIVPISALRKFNINPIFDKILNLLPESPPFFEKNALTDRNERFFVEEIIREKILLHYQKEIPYSAEIKVEEFKELADIIHLRAIIYVERKTQKGIIIGHKGLKLKRIGTEARADLEEFFSKKIYLQLYVKIKEDWRKNEQSLRDFGYDFN